MQEPAGETVFVLVDQIVTLRLVVCFLSLDFFYSHLQLVVLLVAELDGSLAFIILVGGC